MNFSRRYLLWLILPPPLITLPISVVFLSQVLHSRTVSEWLSILGFFIAVGLIGELIFITYVRPVLAHIDAGDTSSEAISLALRRTAAGSLAGWGVGLALITVGGALLFHRSPLGFAYFFVAGLGAAVPSICWSYAVGKRLLERITPATGTRWVGPRIPIGRKIAVVFVGFFIVSSLALVLLVSSKVSKAIEELALSGAEEAFTGVYALAQTGGASDEPRDEQGKFQAKSEATTPDDSTQYEEAIELLNDPSTRAQGLEKLLSTGAAKKAMVSILENAGLPLQELRDQSDGARIERAITAAKVPELSDDTFFEAVLEVCGTDPVLLELVQSSDERKTSSGDGRSAQEWHGLFITLSALMYRPDEEEQGEQSDRQEHFP